MKYIFTVAICVMVFGALAAHAKENLEYGGFGQRHSHYGYGRYGHDGKLGVSVHLQEAFDPIGPEAHSLTMPSGRKVFYIDEGKPGWTPVVYLSGQGTSLQSFQLTEFARSSRQALKLRVISVERNGFGASSYDASLGYEDYVNEVLAVLAKLNINRFVIEAISGGGAYAPHLAARVPDRVISMHLASVSPQTLPTRGSKPSQCFKTNEEVDAENVKFTHHPKAWWAEPPQSPTNRIPGWQFAANLDAVRAFYMNGQLGAPDALTHEDLLPCQAGAVVTQARLNTVRAPVYLYWGGADSTVPIKNMALWSKALPNVVAERVYPEGGHTVQYRHWDQILIDMAGFGEYTVLCVHGKTRVVRGRQARQYRRHGATLGICAWAASANQSTGPHQGDRDISAR